MKILCVGDVHLSDKPPQNCTEAYNDQIFMMLHEIVNVAVREDVAAVVFAGDIFHHKAANRTSHRTVQRMIEVIQRFSCPVFLVVGNHDITNDRLDSISETQPFGVLLRAGARPLEEWAVDADGPSELPLYGVPWQMDWSDASDAFACWRDSVWGDESSLIVTHAPLYPPGKELPWENVPASTVASWCGQRASLYYGHVHPRHGVFTCDGVVFCNQGAISRGSLHEEDISRHPAVTIWDDTYAGTEQVFRRVELASAPPAEEVFRLDVAAERENYERRMSSFLTSVGSASVEVSSVEGVLHHVQSLDSLSAEDKKLAEEVLMAASAGELK